MVLLKRLQELMIDLVWNLHLWIGAFEEVRCEEIVLEIGHIPQLVCCILVEGQWPDRACPCPVPARSVQSFEELGQESLVGGLIHLRLFEMRLQILWISIKKAFFLHKIQKHQTVQQE